VLALAKYPKNRSKILVCIERRFAVIIGIDRKRERCRYVVFGSIKRMRKRGNKKGGRFERIEK